MDSAKSSRRIPRFGEGGRKFWVLSQTALSSFFSSSSFLVPPFFPSSPLFLPWSKSAIISRRKYFLMRGLPPERPTDGRTDGSAATDRSSARARESTTHARRIGRGRTAATDKSDARARGPGVGQSERRRRNNKYPCCVSFVVSLGRRGIRHPFLLVFRFMSPVSCCSI